MTPSAQLARAYFNGLRDACYRQDARNLWDHFASIVHGAAQSDLDQLVALYPDTPESLLELLRLVDGTYWREYQGEKVHFLCLGSDLEEFPYYLLSTQEIIADRDNAKQCFDYIITREYDDVPVAPAITNNLTNVQWLHFADCFNNGGCSQLFIDFSPSPTGTKGQILRYLHDPDEMTVIAPSFDAYLQMLIDQDFDFINEDTIDD